MLDAKQLVERMKVEIIEDVTNGIVPVTVASFAELHNYVDANCYGGTEALWEDMAANVSESDDETTAKIRDELFNAMNKAMDIVDMWIKSGELRCISH